MLLDRRDFLLGGPGLVAAATLASPHRRAAIFPRRNHRPPPDFSPILARLGRGGRLGVAALDVQSRAWIGHDVNSRYAMCSTFKLPLAAAILAAIEHGRLRLDEEIPYGRADLLPNSPVTEAKVGLGRLPVERLCAAAVEVSDNAAANLLIARVGGPAGLTAFIRGAGDHVTRCDRIEPALNSNIPGDPRDTTTPAAMVSLLRTLLLGDRLSAASRQRLIGWMEGATTGLERLRAGLPAGWRVGDKTGTGHDETNDFAIAWPPGRGPILIVSMTQANDHDAALRNGVHADVARLAAESLS